MRKRTCRYERHSNNDTIQRFNRNSAPFFRRAAGVDGAVASLALQGRGHKLDAFPPEPVTGPRNFGPRFFFEQWITFPPFRPFRSVVSCAFRSANELSV